MKKTIDFKKYGPIISDKIIGEDIYKFIISCLESNPHLSIDMTGVVSMATFCAKQIFGKLYISLTPEVFFDRIEFINVSDDVKLIIKIGIQNAIEEIEK